MRFIWQYLVQRTLALACVNEIYLVVLEIKHTGIENDFAITY
jgi:hypothetical protein